MLHRFSDDISSLEIPEQFNNPFHYRPHPLCVGATEEVRRFLNADDTLRAEVAKGKMFGVLVVRDSSGEIGYLAAFSGLLAGGNEHPFFVPAVYDMLSPDGYFKIEESEISNINEEIRMLLASDGYIAAKGLYDDSVERCSCETEAMRNSMHDSKLLRDVKRSSGQLSHEESAALIAESQFQKAELKRLQKKWKEKIAECAAVLNTFTEKLNRLKEERRRRSAALQEWLFKEFVVFNANGEYRNLFDIFMEYRGVIPPAGAGECAAPKLLQYAYLNNMQPLAMAEFWVGESPVGEVRRDGCFYGSCKGKCEPILSFMLQGLNVENSLLDANKDSDIKLDVLFEDDKYIVVNKPSGILSVPGKVGLLSLQELLCNRCCNENIKVAHRLDMATSGLLVAAKDNEAYKSMQALFAERKVNKIYYALLDGVPSATDGEISLPLSADYMNRPRQMVDFESGSSAVTQYRILSTRSYKGRECALAELRPHTGRTHQLRVHCAHRSGLDTPIVGDELYGKADERLFLHAAHLSFVHPYTGESLSFDSPAEFL